MGGLEPNPGEWGAGFGIFDDELLPKYYFFSGSLNPPFTQRSSVTNPPFPNLLANFDPVHVKYQLQTTNYDLQNPCRRR